MALHKRNSRMSRYLEKSSLVLVMSTVIGFGITSCSSDNAEHDEVVEANSQYDGSDSASSDTSSGYAEQAAADGSAVTEQGHSESADAASGDQAVASAEEAAPAPATVDSENYASEEHKGENSEANGEISNAPSTESLASTTDTANADLAVNTASPASDEPSAAQAAPATDSAAALFDKPAQPSQLTTVSSPGAAQNLPDRPGTDYAEAGHHKYHHHHMAKNRHHKAIGVDKKSSGTASTSQYVVEPGDTLALISQKIYGSTKHWQAIAQLNSITDPNRIFSGDVVKFSVEDAHAQEFVKGYRTTMKTIVVKKGDSLSKLATQAYGSPGAWKRLLSFNHEKIQDPNKIYVGMKLEYMEGGVAASNGAKANNKAAPGGKPKKATGH